MATDPHADLVGSSVTVTLTNGSVISGGRLLPRLASTTPLVRVDLGSGAEVMLHPGQVHAVNAYDTAQTGRDGHLLAGEYDTITAAHWADSSAVHEAAHAVVGLVIGMDIASAQVADGRIGRIDGHVAVNGGADAQASAVFYLAGPIAHARRIGELGYGPTTQAAMDMLPGQTDRAHIAEAFRRGYIVWEHRAYKDVETLLDQAAVWAKVLEVGAALAEAGFLSRADLDALVGDPAELCDHRIWTP